MLNAVNLQFTKAGGHLELKITALDL